MAALARQTTYRGFLGSTESFLMGNTTLSKGSPFNFGVTRSRQSAPAKKVAQESIVKSISFSIVEARDRIRDFVNGTYKPKALSDLLSYLSDHMLHLETRKSKDGASANYLVDMKSKQALLASSVDRRLSRPGLARTYGKTLEAEAESLRRKTSRTPEQVLAYALRNQNAGRLLSADQTKTPFDDWNDLVFSSPAMFDGREVNMQGNELWLGKPYLIAGSDAHDATKVSKKPAIASSDPQENIRIMRKAAKAGKKLIAPAATDEDLKAGRLTPGMPFLKKEGAVRMRLIDPRLSHMSLASAFGSTFRDRYGKMEKAYSGRMSSLKNGGIHGNKVVDLDAFRKQFGRTAAKEVTPKISAAPQTAVSRNENADVIVRHDINHDGRERITFVNQVNGEEVALGKNTSPGRYPKEDSFGLPAGYLIVDHEGGYIHIDNQERYHNPLGPAIVPPAGSNEAPRYAVNGEFRSAPRNNILTPDEKKAPSYRA